MANRNGKVDKKNHITEIDDHIRNSFDIRKRLGKGAYGIVWKAFDRKTGLTVAVKKIFDAFRNETDAQRTFREIMFLRAFRNHPNIIQLFSIHRAANHLDIYLSFEYMESDLHNVIKRGSILKDVHKRYIMYQLFNATKFIHSGNVIHRDMKPSNVLIDSKCRCKLADFGLARSLSSQYQVYDRCSGFGDTDIPCLTDYVATRWYRAPEILIANKSYTKGIDMWSLGCILGEMVRGKPLFPGSCTVKQVECIVRALPPPSDNDLKAVGEGFGTCLLNQINKTTNSPNPYPRLDEMLVDSTSDARHLITTLLQLNPTKRLTASQAMDHRYVEKFRNTVPELELTADVLPPFRDDVQFSVSEYRSKLYEIIATADKVPQNKSTKKTGSLSSSPNASLQSQNSLDSVTHSSDINKLYREFNSLSTQSHALHAHEKRIQSNYKTNSHGDEEIYRNANDETKAFAAMNCCKNCNRDTSNRRSHGVIMPKLPNSYAVLDETSYKSSKPKKSASMLLEMRRNSMDANAYFRRMASKQPIGRNKLLENVCRRKSLDEDVQHMDVASKQFLSKRVLSSAADKNDLARKLLVSSKTIMRAGNGAVDSKTKGHLTALERKMKEKKRPSEPPQSMMLKKHDEQGASNKFRDEYKYAL